jgi:uncharacterized protein (DUF2141 family)
MPAGNVTVKAIFEAEPVIIQTYAVTVINGSGSGDYEAGATVSITAEAAPTGKTFDRWTSADGVSFANENSAVTTFVMPAKAVTVTATYKDLPAGTYLITVVSGSADKASAAAGETVTITANTAPTGKTFDKWTTTDGITIANENATGTTFVMIAQSVTVTATYKDLPAGTYSITVQNDGHGTANADVTSATAGTEITLTATANSGYLFKEWQVISGGVNIVNDKFTMPAGNVTVKAIFEAEPVIPTYAVTVISGNGSGDYEAGANVSIVANAPEAGKVFDKWTTTDGVTFANATAATTTFVMLAKAVTVTATYKDNVNTGVGEIASSNPLKAWMRNGLLHVEGLTAGETLSIYSVSGQLAYQSVATSEEMDIPLKAEGVYIIQSGNNTVKAPVNF